MSDTPYLDRGAGSTPGASPLCAATALRLLGLAATLLAVWACRPDAERVNTADDGDGSAALPREVVVRGSAMVAGDWRYPGGDAGQSGYSRLTAIHGGNVTSLEPAWRFVLERQPTGPDAAPVARATPLVVGGVIYLAHGGRVSALDGTSGEEIWRHTPAGVTFGSRGLAYWPGDGQIEPRLFVAASDRLLALNARTGSPVAGFGAGGQVVVAVADGAAPLVAGTRIIVASAVGPGVRAWHLNSGRESWRYDAAEWSSGRGQVSAVSADPDRSLLYVTFSAHAEFHSLATGEDVPPSSLIVLDIADGNPVWRFDAVRRDVWRHGIVNPPLLYPAWRNTGDPGGVALISGAGLVYLLDRISGEPRVEVIDRPVPQHPPTAIPLAPTQPFPQGAAVHSYRLARGELLVDASQTDSFHASACTAMTGEAESAETIGPFSPLLTDGDAGQPGAVVRFPDGARFGTHGGLALDPQIGYLFVNVSHVAAVSTGPARRDSTGSQAGAIGAGLSPPADAWAAFVAQPRTPTAQGGWPCQPPPWGELIAVNTVDGGIAWRVPLGVTDGLSDERRATGRPGRGGPLATAGGLVFVASTDDRSLRAFASNNGEELWRAQLPMNAFATPWTYRGADGRQYVAVIAAGGTILDSPVWSPAAMPQLLTFAIRDP